MLVLLAGMGQAGMSAERWVQEELPSRFLGTNRMVRIYLPADYAGDSSRRFPVLYLHDGQNVFSTAGKDCCFGWGSWELDRVVEESARAGRMREVILVAVDNSRFRYQEYRGPAYPYTEEELTALKNRPSGAGDDTRFKNYASFLIHELKPKIDREFRTKSDAAHTGVMGSSLGGICSLALAWENPRVFGLAASLSGSFQVERTNLLRNVLGRHRGRPKPIRIYLDSGVVDYSGGDDGRQHTARVVGELRRIGWRENLLHFVDERILTEEEMDRAGLPRHKWAEAGTSQHNEFYWRQRAHRALEFLFPVEGR